MPKERLDVLLVKNKIAPSREKAKAMIMEGLVYVDGSKEDKAGSLFRDTAQIEYRGKKLKYVSRGGLKLEKALSVFPVKTEGRICMDIGASTGGFTDCMLQNGALKVYAIDVGYGQLDYRLRQDPKVVCMEKTNFRFLKKSDFEEEPDLASVDVSFISLSIILPVAYDILGENAEMVCLIKPQFEAGREKVGKKGVVRDPSVHEEVIKNCVKFAEDAGFKVGGLDYSPIRGPEGNIEYLMYLMKGQPGSKVDITQTDEASKTANISTKSLNDAVDINEQTESVDNEVEEERKPDLTDETVDINEQTESVDNEVEEERKPDLTDGEVDINLRITVVDDEVDINLRTEAVHQLVKLAHGMLE